LAAAITQRRAIPNKLYEPNEPNKLYELNRLCDPGDSPHDAFKKITLDELKSIMNASPILIDVRGLFEPAKAEHRGFYHRSFIIEACELR